MEQNLDCSKLQWLGEQKTLLSLKVDINQGQLIVNNGLINYVQPKSYMNVTTELNKQLKLHLHFHSEKHIYGETS